MKLYMDLLNLANTNEAFYFSDQTTVVNGVEYVVRSFSYRLASWSDFQLPSAKESRGTAFYAPASSDLNNPDSWDLFARAYKKFFNLGEGISVETYIDSHKPLQAFQKLDGSLIIIGLINGKLIAKSKTSINSEQAIMAQKILDSDENISKYCFSLLNNNITPVFELVGPSNIIVLRYSCDELIFLGAVENQTGLVTPITNPDEFYQKTKVKCAQTSSYSWEELLEIKENSSPDIEGFVVWTSNNEFVKVKVNSYINLHHLKDNVNNIKSLSLLILNDELDDLIANFREDQKTVDYIIDMQTRIGHIFNHLVNSVEYFYSKYKTLDRKSFALTAQKEVPTYMGLVMALYLGKKINYKEFFMKHKMYKYLMFF